MNTVISVQDRIHGALWGALVGDALGVPVEFQSRQALRENPVTAMRGFGTHGQPSGTWSDDSSLLLCTVDSFTTCGKLNVHDLASRFVRWGVDGYCTPHGGIFDVGIATSEALSNLQNGVPPEEAGRADEYSNGNGSLMRILPVALWFLGATPEELMVSAQRASTLTHRHPRSQMACALYCLLVRALVQRVPPDKAWSQAVDAFAAYYERPPYIAERLHFRLIESGNLANQTERDIDSTGYVMHTLAAAVWCLLTSRSFEETVLKAVNLGGDTDTTGCVAGGLAGACYGMASIPPDWKSVLARHDDVQSMLARFLDRLPAPSAISQ
ncbi:ADP-ribosylation/Crystallin J1 [Chthoniobacter flavus Ellin428]|uniref:ADP-ribosylation/Crystallin J1 n=1 Tax=Chthoniobacter flavus Ellin428 TaxID=497964 RepID=B4CZ88_9BACT|nr:ADP-ribosylglycohydrolase family protein [Chthoniobacter flavus]EDY20779.1 ADP-ribosylation/Crystallin J1 [Chthoniobacter flavus Ellin428]TCO89673.1 ADP-ribosylglycohydrolase [Chthoniobacter flavus]